MDEFKAAARLDSNLVAPRYQMFMMFRESGRKAEADAAFRDFRMVKARQEGPAGAQEDVNWCYYSEIYDPSDARPEKRQAKISPEFAARILTGRADAGSAHLMPVDFDSDGKPDLLIWSNSGVLLYRAGRNKWMPV